MLDAHILFFDHQSEFSDADLFEGDSERSAWDALRILKPYMDSMTDGIAGPDQLTSGVPSGRNPDPA